MDARNTVPALDRETPPPQAAGAPLPGIVYCGGENQPAVAAFAAVGGRKEKDGPLGDRLDFHDPGDKFGQKTFENAESEMQHIALSLAFKKGGWQPSTVNAIFAGDLMNQCTASAYGLLSYDIPYFGIYGACSSSAEGLCLASMLLQGGIYSRVGVVVSSHYASAERQFRFPLEYGAQRTPTSQWTVTGAGAFLLGRSRDMGSAPHVKVADVMPGRSVDGGITDLNNMGAAMAPAAVDSFLRYFGESGTGPQDYDLIVSGDLGYEGHGIVKELLAPKGYDMDEVYDDCGLLIYDRKKQDMHAGGSGCGCSASVLAGFILPEMLAGRLENVLFMATGALMSPSSVQQGGSIPGIAHIVHFTVS